MGFLDTAGLKRVVGKLTTLLNGKAPTAHADSTTAYGKATATNYGHTRLSDSTTSTSGTGGGYAATPSAVKKAYDLAADAQPAVARGIIAAGEGLTLTIPDVGYHLLVTRYGLYGLYRWTSQTASLATLAADANATVTVGTSSVRIVNKSTSMAQYYLII